MDDIENNEFWSELKSSEENRPTLGRWGRLTVLIMMSIVGWCLVALIVAGTYHLVKGWL